MDEAFKVIGAKITGAASSINQNSSAKEEKKDVVEVSAFEEPEETKSEEAD